MSLLPRKSILSLYRQLLHGAKHFPSIRRSAIYDSIKADFRDHQYISDPQKIRSELTRAIDGLHHLQQYNDLVNSKSSVWELNLYGGDGKHFSGEINHTNSSTSTKEE